MAENPLDIVSVLQRHLDPCIDMLAQVIARCPEELWAARGPGAPIWQHLYHTLVGPDFWFRASRDAPFAFSTFGKDVSPDLAQESLDFLTKEELTQYIQKTREVCAGFLAGIAADCPTETSALSDTFTKADLVLMQIRHFQHHVGYCNGRLREHSIEGAPWLGYGE